MRQRSGAVAPPPALASGPGALTQTRGQARLDRFALLGIGLCAAITLAAAGLSGHRTADLPDWLYRAWHFGAPLALGLGAIPGLTPGRSRLVRALAILTVAACALPAALDRWDLPMLDGVPLKLAYGVTVFAVLGARAVLALSGRGRVSAGAPA